MTGMTVAMIPAAALALVADAGLAWLALGYELWAERIRR